MLAPMVIRCLPVSVAVSAMIALGDMAVSGFGAVEAGRRDMDNASGLWVRSVCESLQRQFTLCQCQHRLSADLHIPKTAIRLNFTSSYPALLASSTNYKSLLFPTLVPFFLSSLALFAFWLRSSVVSVLFSLISEIFLREYLLINLIFFHSSEAAGLAHASGHCVTGLTLPPVDAKNHFSSMVPVDLGLWRRDIRI